MARKRRDSSAPELDKEAEGRENDREREEGRRERREGGRGELRQKDILSFTLY